MPILGTNQVLISEHMTIPELGSPLKTGWNVQGKSDTCIMSYNTQRNTLIFYSKHETTTCTEFSTMVFGNTKKTNITIQQTE